MSQNDLDSGTVRNSVTVRTVISIMNTSKQPILLEIPNSIIRSI